MSDQTANKGTVLPFAPRDDDPSDTELYQVAVLDQQIAGLPPAMSLNTQPGEWVRFTANGGPDWEIADAKAVLTLGCAYKVEAMDIGGTSSRVVLQDGAFNTVMFENMPEPEAG